MSSRKPYPTDVSDEEWAFVAPYLSLIRQDAPQRRHSRRREVSTGSPVDRAHRLAVALPAQNDLLVDALGGRLPAETQRWIARPGSSRRWSTTSGPCCA
jgi:transposase